MPQLLYTSLFRFAGRESGVTLIPRKNETVLQSVNHQKTTSPERSQNTGNDAIACLFISSLKNGHLETIYSLENQKVQTLT